MRRGDIVTVAGGVYATKPRPALVVQDDRSDDDSVDLLERFAESADFPVRIEATQDNGLDQDSFLMVEKITTVRRTNAHTVLGRLDSSTMVEFERRLLVFLGFGA